MSAIEWKAEVERRAAEVEAQKVRLRLAVMLLADALRNTPEEGDKLDAR